MENKNLLSVPDDHYSAAIDFSNACREFYINRVRATESFKEQMKEEEKSKHERPLQRKRSSIDIAMETLRKEMASLMDQDLCLMKQLLTLNETIEDIKTRRWYSDSQNSLKASSVDLGASDASLSETDMYAPDEGVLDMKDSARIVPKICIESDDSSIKSNKNDKCVQNAKFVDTQMLVNGKSVHIAHGVQSSVDSGYGDCDSMYQKDIEVTL
uniref:Uncharacterized protein LOC111120928 n=1 Tax=Crassostrea virginica TaxID=6565 RepID=A0A8B8CPH1_CRAVI|nr:uncharacterized protein LOC111120928 [Crassostrea virginica]